MNQVRGVEELRHGGIDVAPSFVKLISTLLYLRIIGVIKDQARISLRAVVVDPVVSAFPILMSEDLNT